MLESVCGKGKLSTPLVGMYIGTVTMENRKKLKVKLHLIQNPILEHISRENHGSKEFMHPKIHCSAVSNMQDMEAT